MTGQFRLDRVNDVDGGGAAIAQDGHERAAVAVDADDAGLDGGAVAHLGDVAHINGGAVDDADRKVVELFDEGAGCC